MTKERDAGALAVTYHNTGRREPRPPLRAVNTPPRGAPPAAPRTPHVPAAALHVHAMHSLFMAATTLCSFLEEFFSRSSAT